MINLEGLGDFAEREDMEKEIQQRIAAYNEKGLADFEGLSPEQIHALQRNFPTSEYPLMLNQLSEEELKNAPLLMQVRYLVNRLKGGQELKLTKTGALPTKLVKEIYDLGYLKNDLIEEGIYKLYKEDDAMEISLTRILLELSSLAKVRNGKLSLTKKGEKVADDGNAILKEILTVLFHKFNWGFYDGYDSEEIGINHAAFSLFLLKKYGDKLRLTDFYAEKYFIAFPYLQVEERNAFRCYATRTFDRYFYFLGFVEKKKEGILDPIEIRKTSFFDRLFSIDPH